MKRLIAPLGILLAFYSFALSQNATRQSKDEESIRTVIANLSEAWTKGDAKLWGAQFAEDADFTVWTGTYVKGREAITDGHEEIFNTIYKGTKLRLTVQSIRFLRKDVAVARTDGRVVKKEEEFPAKPQNVQVFILTKEKGQWKIAVFQNTRIQSREESKKVKTCYHRWLLKCSSQSNKSMDVRWKLRWSRKSGEKTLFSSSIFSFQFHLKLHWAKVSQTGM